MEVRVEGKVIVVTGGAAGIGLELVKALAPYNTVYVVDRDQSKLDEVGREFPASVKGLCVDLADWDQTARVLDEALPPLVHCLVNNAGVGGEGGFLNTDEALLDKVIAVNTRAIVCVSQIVAKRIIAYNATKPEELKVIGSIVNVSSLASRFPTRVSLAYNLSKAAVDMVTKGMALELGPVGIRVNSVNPNIVMTDLARQWLAARPQAGGMLIARTPLGKFVDIQDVVNTIVFLLWDRVTMVHGESVFVDGGFSVT